ncbi:hypothetical protein PPYR_10597 [Photinus pyralis]|uniref:PLAT domain-containing protein n=1 Tax=Photinus pyralis TaxID=7054 RepID=A0A5N4AGX4_PHOPY|nr:hypothetical protein PPYR_10597 [Photinus pyralis]
MILQVLFLPDNVEEGYAYLVIVKTGSQFFSGTSSNIGLVIYGLEECSKAHLLNYPDPNEKLLQRGGEDWFVLTSGKCLGEIDYIWLWFDSVGQRPSWYCEWVKILDVTTGQDWFFDVQALLAVTDDGYCRVAVSPSSKVRKTGWVTFINQHAWNVTQTTIGKLGYQERITVVLSTVLTTSSFSLLLHNRPSLRLLYGLGQGHFSYKPELLALAILSALASFGINRVFFTFFSNSEHYLLTWIGLIATILINLAYLILFGFGNSNVTALMWMTSTLSSLVQVVLLETLYGLLNRAQSQETPIDLREVLAEAQRQKHKLNEKFGPSLLRPYFTTKYRALTVEEWKAKREVEMERYRLATLLQDLFMFIVYIVLLYLVVLANRDTRIVYGNESIKNLMVSEDFEDIKEIDDIYEYVNESLIPTLHSTRWYGAWTTNEPGLMADFNTKILGVARLRQVRVSEDCIFSSHFQAELLCLPEYAQGHNDVLGYAEYWEPLTQVAVPRFADAWRYKVDGMNTFGFMGGYPNGGYGALLGRTLYNSYYNLHYLEDTQWVTRSTRAGIIEFLAYNANYNVFHVVTLIVESSATGLITTSSQQEFELMIAVECAAFIIVTMIMLTKNLIIAKRRWSSYIRSTWNIVDVAIIAMSLLCVGIYYHRSDLVGQFLYQLERARNNQFLGYFHLVSMERFLTVLGAALIFVATVRLWKFLRFIAGFRVVERTFEMSAIFLLGLWVCHCIFIAMYTILGTSLFGSRLDDFHTFFSTFRTLALLSMDLYEDFDFLHFVEVGGFLAMIYYSSFIFIMLMVYTMYVSLLVLCYSDSTSHFSNLHHSRDVAEFFTGECRYYNAVIHRYIGNFRLEAGDDEEKRKVTPKSDQHRYANVVTVSERKLRAMSAVTQSLIAKRVGGERSIDLIANLLYYLVTKDEVDDNKMLGFIDQQDHGSQIVSDYRLLQMEYAANYIIAAGTEEDSRIETFEPISKQRSENALTRQLNDILKALKLLKKVLKSIKATSKTLRCDCSCRRKRNYFIHSVKNKD